MSSTSLKLKPARDQRGSALVLALIVVMLVAMLGGGLLQLTSAVTRRQTAAVDQTRAFYLAEAGLAEAFQAVRIGRTGQIGSEAAPARYGNGLVWVDATETSDGHIRLEATGMIGPGRASLAFVVEPVEVSLGFFSDEDLVVESVLLMDGFDSDEGRYEDQLTGETIKVPTSAYYVYDDEARGILYYEGTFYRYSSVKDKGKPEVKYYYDHAVDYPTLVGSLEYSEFDLHEDDFLDEDWLDDFDTDQEYGAVLEYFAGIPGVETGAVAGVDVDLGPTTGGGALLSSNGGVTFSLPEEDQGVVYGDVLPGPLGSVSGLGPVTVTGSTDSRSTEIELPEVEIPEVALAMPVRHEGLLPLVVSAGTSGFESIEVAADSELTLYGPATIVIGQLTLEPGALLTLDTRNGDVELYITGGLDLQLGSIVSTSGELPDEISVQVAPIPTFDKAPVSLEATSQFHGTIYAPETEVKVGTDFEIYGGVVARKLEIGPDAKLHFDSSGFEGSAIPRIVSWKIIELPAVVRGRQGDPFTILGVDEGGLEDLAHAHDLSAVVLNLTYVGKDGSEYNYSGTEDEFDWTAVALIVSIERDATRTVEDEPEQTPPEEDPPVEDPPLEGVRPEVADAIASMSGGTLRDFLKDKTPLSDSELISALQADSMTGGHYLDVLEQNNPLGDAVLLEAMTGAGVLDPGHLEEVLVDNSPLLPDTLDLAMGLPHSQLTSGQKGNVLANQ